MKTEWDCTELADAYLFGAGSANILAAQLKK
jgi:hypothetical protein